MTSKGIRLNDDMYYECDRAEFEDWKVIARSNGRWKLEAGLTKITPPLSMCAFVQAKVLLGVR